MTSTGPPLRLTPRKLEQRRQMCTLFNLSQRIAPRAPQDGQLTFRKMRNRSSRSASSRPESAAVDSSRTDSSSADSSSANPSGLEPSGGGAPEMGSSGLNSMVAPRN